MPSRCVQFAICLAMSVSLLAAASCGKKSPTEPATPTPTRIINITGNLGFGTMAVGSTAQKVVQIQNTGNAVMTVTALGANGIGVESSDTSFTATWISGTIAAGATQSVTIFFTPNKVNSYVGNFIVACDCTGGFNTLPLTANVVAPQ